MENKTFRNKNLENETFRKTKGSEKLFAHTACEGVWPKDTFARSACEGVLPEDSFARSVREGDLPGRYLHSPLIPSGDTFICHSERRYSSSEEGGGGDGGRKGPGLRIVRDNCSSS